MGISDFTIRLILLFFPGILAACLIEKFTVQAKPRDAFSFVLKSFVYGFFAYFLYFLIIYDSNWLFAKPTTKEVIFLKALTNPAIALSFKEIFFVSISAIWVSSILILEANRKWGSRFLKWLRFTKKHDDFDVWAYVFNLEEIDWVTVRDHKNNLTFDGWVQAFSEDSKDAEILLRDVSIYKNDSGEPLYQSGAVYLSRNRYEITLEFRTIPISEDRIWKETNNDGRQGQGTGPEINIEGEPREKGRSEREASNTTPTTTEGAKPA